VRLPAADDLFRPTTGTTANDASESAHEPAESAEQGEQGGSGRRKPSGRVRHDEKMTIYVTADELLDIEHARLMMRRNHGLAVDRGRLVREAVAIALADFEANGDDSLLVQRLTQK
jgi:hypothetical protein